MNTIIDYKRSFEKKLPREGRVIDRNKAISSIYANLYLQNPDVFKWAGMAAFASNHIGIGLLPYHIKGFELLNLSESCKHKGLVNDFNLLRHINNRIFDDIAWTHQAYLDGGILLLEDILSDDPHYHTMLIAWKNLDAAVNNSKSNSANVWAANAELLRHEQEMVVQPMFDRFGALFKRVLTLCASLDFNPNHFGTNFKYHSSFLWYTYRRQFGLLKESSFLPDLTQFNQRWTWLENKVITNWIANEKHDKYFVSKVETIYNFKGC